MGLGNGGDQGAQEADDQASANVWAGFVEGAVAFEYVGLDVG